MDADALARACADLMWADDKAAQADRKSVV
jgi:hypothetical protein